MMSYFTSAVQSFMSVVLNKQASWLLKAKYQPIIIATLWISTLCACFMGYATLDIYVYILPSNLIAYYDKYNYDAYSLYIVYVIVIMLLMSTCVVLYSGIYVKLRLSSRRIHATNSQTSNRQARDKRTVIKLLVLCLCFVLSYTPMWMLTIFFMSLSLNHLMEIYFVCMALHIVVYTLNPVMYCMLFTDIGTAFHKHVFKRMISHERSSTSQNAATT